jgi:hypothetical protein
MAQHSSTLDSPSETALMHTQHLLNDPAQRSAALKDTSGAQMADQQVQGLSGGSKDTADAIYGLSSSIFANLAKNASGDSSAMQKSLEQAQKDPEGFMNSLTPAQKKNLEAIAQQIQNQRGPSSQP